MIVQIYGLTTPADAEGVAGLGPDHAGVVLDEGIDTWDCVDEMTARAIAAALRPVRVVALSLSTDPDRIRRTVGTVEPDIVHLARAAGAISPEDLDRLRSELRPVELMVTVPVLGPSAIEVARRLAPCCDYLLLDSAHPVSGVVGATGFVHDWSVSGAVAAAMRATPVILAGGLGPHNVADAIRTVGPDGVDSETRTSLSVDRRRKDLDKVRAFIDRARRASSEHAGAS